jgi:hypothetical protein
MAMYHSRKADELDPHKLPNVMVAQLTATELAAGLEDEIHEFMKLPEFRLASMNSRVRDLMLDAIVREMGLEGGWCWCYCLPGCLPDSAWFGPFETLDEAIEDFTEE